MPKPDTPSPLLRVTTQRSNTDDVLRLTKHHGLGNDFLVLIDLDRTVVIDGDWVEALCARHTGVGADGLIRASSGETEPFRFELWNEDGSVAAMSGNGIACMTQALVRAGLAADELSIETPAGVRVVEVVDRPDTRTHRFRVQMGTPTLGDDAPEWTDDRILRATFVDVGNPHLVCHVPDAADRPDLWRFGAAVNDAVPGGVNVELVSPGDGLEMVVYERGVGPTLACGTGAVASALAAHHWGLAPAEVSVHQPGGTATVTLGEPVTLTVPSVAIATIEVPA